jgi:mono/diheme cytochrome c family protein
LSSDDGQWHRLRALLRSSRTDAAFKKTEDALLIDLRVDDAVVARDRIFATISPDAPNKSTGQRGPVIFVAKEAPLALRNFQYRAADFDQVTLPSAPQGKSNADDLIDFVALGKDTFESVGCAACHIVSKGAGAVSTGPNLFGLFRREPRMREVAEGAERNRFTVTADRAYLHRSVRSPTDQLAIAESGTRKGQPYEPVMPVFTPELLSDVQLDAIGAYLMTLNEPADQGPAIQLMPKSGAEHYDPIADRFQLLVDDELRIQRGPLPGVSARAIHVGQVNGVNYSFDPRILAIAKVWQGGFLDRSGELLNRGGKGYKIGYESREIGLGNRDYLFAPLNAAGELIDFTFKDVKFGDAQSAHEALYSKEDHLAKLAAIDAQFLGYEKPSARKDAAPTFKYRVGKNTLNVRTVFELDGNVTVHIEGKRVAPQAFAINTDVLSDIKTHGGELAADHWTLPPGNAAATLHAKIALAQNVWHAPASAFDYRKQPLEITPAKATLPAGYSVENYNSPKDNYGRDQLFEALGLALADDGTIVVATRTAGVWRVKDGQWRLFAEGTFDSLGVLLESKDASTIVVGQKPELTRISDTDGDGIADRYQTLFDAHTYHGNYHNYMHGPVRGADGAYYININLAHADDGSTYKAGGLFMGSSGGFAGWCIRVEPNGKFTPWANGMRSPAGIGLAPDGRLWYAENQGEYVATSKMFLLQRGAFYGHPSSLVDLPGMTPDSEEIAWSRVAARRARPVILFPHNRVANSPGNPVWDTTQGKFGAFAGQMFIGDQTQSNLLRVVVERVNGTEQGSVMPFMSGLESGVMRPLFLPDSSLLLGQTGRGWQAKGGHVASLQRVRWDGHTIEPAIKAMAATPHGFKFELTQPLKSSATTDQIASALQIESWVYRDAPDYGSDELDSHPEDIAGVRVESDRKGIEIELASTAQRQVHPQQTARVYHAQLASGGLFDSASPEKMEAYYTLYAFPAAD